MSSVSVIIPCFKDAATLSRALDSVFAQTVCVYEVIVVNDMSPETVEIERVIQYYPKVIYIKSNENKGLAATRNTGVSAATGEVISFLDADDELHPQKIEAQLSLFNPDIALSCKVKRIGDEVGIANAKHYSNLRRYSFHRNARSLARSNRLVGASLMISRKLFLSVGEYNESLRSCEDFDLWLRLLDAKVLVVNIELPLYFYRVNEAGLSRNYLNISRWELEVVRRYFDRHRLAGHESPGEGLTLLLWLLKHLIRYEECRVALLLENTVNNIELLNRWPLRKRFLILTHRSKLIFFFLVFKKLYAQIFRRIIFVSI